MQTNTTIKINKFNNIAISGVPLWSISATNPAGSICIHAHHNLLPILCVSVRTLWDEELPQWNRWRNIEGKSSSEIKAIIDGLISEAVHDGITESLDEADGPSYGLFMRMDANHDVTKTRVQTWNIWRALDAVKKQLFEELP